MVYPEGVSRRVVVGTYFRPARGLCGAPSQMLVVFKSAPILKRALKVKQAMMQLYVLKLLKVQTKYLGRQWRKSNMKTMSAIYQKVRHRLNDDWAYGNGEAWHGGGGRGNRCPAALSCPLSSRMAALGRTWCLLSPDPSVPPSESGPFPEIVTRLSSFLSLLQLPGFRPLKSSQPLLASLPPLSSPPSVPQTLPP